MEKVPSKIDLKPVLVEESNENQRQGEVGRYSISQIYAMLEGWTTPEDFINGEIMSFSQAFNCWYGTGKHTQIEQLLKRLGYETEIKKEYDCGDFKIVGRCDFLNEQMVGDLKTSIELIGKAKKWSLFQVKLYCSVFEKEYGVIYEPIIKKEQTYNKMGYPKTEVVDFYLQDIGRTKRNDDWFKKQLIKLGEFHEKVVDYQKSIKTP